MREPLVLRCQCGDPSCDSWVHVHDEDADLIACRDLSIVHPQHAHPTDRIWDVRGPYLVVRLDRTAVWPAGDRVV
jgi:hypothetical protein